MEFAIALPAKKRIRFVRENLRRFLSGQYFFETSVCWLSGDVVRFKIEVGVYEKFDKK